MNIEATEKYYKKIGNSKVICIDFDNTICLDEWPHVGPIIPGASDVLISLMNAGHKLILNTQRSHMYPICCKELLDDEFHHIKTLDDTDSVDLLTSAVNKCNSYGIKFWDINRNSLWESLTGDLSRKIYNDYIIDDHSIGIKKLDVINRYRELCKVVDWFYIDRFCMDEGLYKNSAFKISYHDYLKNIENLNNGNNRDYICDSRSL